jgi:Sigma-70 region 2
VPDRAGFEAFYAAHLPRVVRACALVLLDRGDAEDVAAEVFARLWSHWGQIHGQDLPEAWRDIPFRAWWILFLDSGRAFYLFVAIGDGVTAELRDQAWAVADSLAFAEG